MANSRGGRGPVGGLFGIGIALDDVQYNGRFRHQTHAQRDEFNFDSKLLPTLTACFQPNTLR